MITDQKKLTIKLILRSV